MNIFKKFSLIVLSTLLFICGVFVFTGCKSDREKYKLFVFSSEGGVVQVQNYKQKVKFGDEGSKTFIFEDDDTITLKAIASVGYTFVKWQFNDSDDFNINTNSSEIKFLIDKDCVVKAEFKPTGEITEYTITYPTNQTGYSIDVVSGYSTTVFTGGTFKFKVNLHEDYSNSNIVVKANGEIISSIGGVYTIGNIVEDIVITIEGIELNPGKNEPESPIKTIYGVYTHEGRVTIVPVGQNTCEVVEGEDFKFKLQLKDSTKYKFNDDLVVMAGGKVLIPVNSEYTINSVNSNIEVVIRGVERIKYTITYSGVGYTIEPVTPAECIVPSGVSFIFKIKLNEGYKFGDIVVKANGTTLTEDNQTYMIVEVNENIVITVDGIEVDDTEIVPDRYEIKVTSELFTIIPEGQTEGFNTYEVEDGSIFKFKLKLKDGYKLTDGVKVKANGIELTKQGEYYVIASVVSNIEITVHDIVEDVQEPQPEVVKYTITTNGNLFTVIPEGETEGVDSCEVAKNTQFKFKLKIQTGYKLTAGVKVKANGIELTKQGEYYVIASVVSNIEITVHDIVEDIEVYEFALDFEDADKELNGSLKDYIPQYISFNINSSEKFNTYNASQFIVKYDGEEEKPMKEIIDAINDVSIGGNVTKFTIDGHDFILVNGDNLTFNWDVLDLVNSNFELIIILG